MNTGNFHTQQLHAAHKAYEELNWRLSFLRTLSAKPMEYPTDEEVLKWFSSCPPKLIQNELGLVSTPNAWFKAKFPDHVKQFGPAFLEVRETHGEYSRITPVSLNYDVWAACLSDPGLGMSVVYYPQEMQWYYLEPIQKLYLTTTPDRLQCLYRGFMIQCFQDLNNETSKFSLFHKFRDDETSKAVLQRAKAILSADESFFAPDSLNIRKQGSEWPERVARVLIETVLERREGSVLTLTRAYSLFSALSIERDIAPIKRATFKHMMRDLMKDSFGICLRNDVPDQEGKQQQGWKDIAPILKVA